MVPIVHDKRSGGTTIAGSLNVNTQSDQKNRNAKKCNNPARYTICCLRKVQVLLRPQLVRCLRLLVFCHFRNKNHQYNKHSSCHQLNASQSVSFICVYDMWLVYTCILFVSLNFELCLGVYQLVEQPIASHLIPPPPFLAPKQFGANAASHAGVAQQHDATVFQHMLICVWGGAGPRSSRIGRRAASLVAPACLSDCPQRRHTSNPTLIWQGGALTRLGVPKCPLLIMSLAMTAASPHVQNLVLHCTVACLLFPLRLNG